MNRLFWTLIIIASTGLISVEQSHAESEADCAIWLCLPAGFPSGCSAAYSAFRHRIKHGRSPLPALSSCSTGPNGEIVSGSYQLGKEVFETCQTGYVLRQDFQLGLPRGRCYIEICAPEKYSSNDNTNCRSYDAIKRIKPSYVKMWVNGDYLGQFWYE